MIGSCILGVKLCQSFIFYAYRICIFYANVKHDKQIRIDWIPSLKSENVSHLRKNSFVLYEYCRNRSGCKADLFSLPLFPHIKIPSSVHPHHCSPAHSSVLSWPLRTAGDCRPRQSRLSPALFSCCSFYPTEPHISQLCTPLSRLGEA